MHDSRYLLVHVCDANGGWLCVQQKESEDGLLFKLEKPPGLFKRLPATGRLHMLIYCSHQRAHSANSSMPPTYPHSPPDSISLKYLRQLLDHDRRLAVTEDWERFRNAGLLASSK